MKTWIVKLSFIGLTGEYTSNVEVKARNEKSAVKKAMQTVGNRDFLGVVYVKEAF